MEAQWNCFFHFQLKRSLHRICSKKFPQIYLLWLPLLQARFLICLIDFFHCRFEFFLPMRLFSFVLDFLASLYSSSKMYCQWTASQYAIRWNAFGGLESVVEWPINLAQNLTALPTLSLWRWNNYAIAMCRLLLLIKTLGWNMYILWNLLQLKLGVNVKCK